MSTPLVNSATVASGRLDLERVCKRFGATTALANIDLSVSAGEFVTILGPSGSGKTTLLKVIAGFELPDEGRVMLDGIDVTRLDPAKRNIGMVFQNYALFPHLTVERNVAYPLVTRGLARTEVAVRVLQALRMVELAELAGRLPKQLSGGQQQRVALARAVVFQPRLLLLDEPFCALDRKLREQMQLEVRRLQRRLGLTTLFITHDQEEALIMSDRIGVMDTGRLQQVGTPHEIYQAPANAFVADFIGESNLLSGMVEADSAGARVNLDAGPSIEIASRADQQAKCGQRARVMIRPESCVDLTTGPAQTPTNRIDGTVLEIVYVGVSDKYRLRTAEGLELLVRLPSGPGSKRYHAGESIAVGFNAADARLIELW